MECYFLPGAGPHQTHFISDYNYGKFSLFIYDGLQGIWAEKMHLTAMDQFTLSAKE